MRVSYRWLQQYVDIPWSPEELAERLTMAGVAVDIVEYRGKQLSGVYTGRISQIDPHPNADKLLVCRLDMGAGRPELTIVTGASNVYAGAVVPVAVDGAELPIGLSIQTSDFRGVLSQGMLCSGDELGMEKKLVPPEMRDGIYLLPTDVPLGLDIKEVMGLDDHVLELDLTPNRADCLSVLGNAYETAALANQQVKTPVLVNLDAQPTHPDIAVSVSDPDLCPGFFGLLVEDVQIAPSPLWMQSALQAAGVRPINNLVDITNYVLLELGQPLHAYDLDRLRGPAITARRASAGEQITTLDDERRTLQQDMLVIADGERAIGIAGVMGGKDTEVSGHTRRVFLESAWFLPQSVRRTSRQLGLRTDASSRFDKGVDPSRVLMALGRAAWLITELGCGKPQRTAVGSMQKRVEQHEISLRPARVNRLLGSDIPAAEIKQLLLRLGLFVDDSQIPWRVSVPSRRQDLAEEVDLVEEVARLYGYDRIPVTHMTGLTAMQGRKTPRQLMVSNLRQGAIGLGLSEIVSLSFANPAQIAALVPPEHQWNRALKLQNPLSSERSVMRPTLLLGLLDNLAYNGARQQTDMAIFELATVFVPSFSQDLRQPAEPLHLGIAATGQVPSGWLRADGEYDFFYLKGLIEHLLAPHGIGQLQWLPTAEHPYLHPGRAADVSWQGNKLGFLGELHPKVLEQHGLRKRAVVAELNLEPLLQQAGYIPLYSPLPKFPAVERDLAIILDQQIPAAQVADCIRQAAGELLVDLKLFDVYQGGQVPPGKKSMAYSLVLQSQERTLQEEEIVGVHTRVVEQLAKQLGALLR
jgi:phenylalanyl-tRNA synthetase beta chain